MTDVLIDLTLTEDEEIIVIDSDGSKSEEMLRKRSASPPLMLHRKFARKDPPVVSRERRPTVGARAVGRKDTRRSETDSINSIRFDPTEDEELGQASSLSGSRDLQNEEADENEDARSLDSESSETAGYVLQLCDSYDSRAEHPLRDQITPNPPVPPPGYVLIRHNPAIARPIASMIPTDDLLSVSSPPTPDPLLEPVATLYTTLTSSRPSLLATPLPYTPTISAYPPPTYKGPLPWNRVWTYTSIRSTASKAQMVDLLSRCGVPKRVYDATGVKNKDLYPYIVRHQELNKAAKDALEGN